MNAKVIRLHREEVAVSREAMSKGRGFRVMPAGFRSSAGSYRNQIIRLASEAHRRGCKSGLQERAARAGCKAAQVSNGLACELWSPDAGAIVEAKKKKDGRRTTKTLRPARSSSGRKGSAAQQSPGSKAEA